MQIAAHDFEQLLREHHALMHDYGRAQRRCSEQLRAQAGEIERLEAQAMRLRAQLIARDSALAWQREDHDLLKRAIANAPRRVRLAQRVHAWIARIASAATNASPCAPRAS